MRSCRQWSCKKASNKYNPGMWPTAAAPCRKRPQRFQPSYMCLCLSTSGGENFVIAHQRMFEAPAAAHSTANAKAADFLPEIFCSTHPHESSYEQIIEIPRNLERPRANQSGSVGAQFGGLHVSLHTSTSFHLSNPFIFQHCMEGEQVWTIQ